jgi:hypothetical protein
LRNDNLSLIQIFAPYFSNCIWQHAQVLLIGAGFQPVLAVVRHQQGLAGRR